MTESDLSDTAGTAAAPHRVRLRLVLVAARGALERVLLTAARRGLDAERVRAERRGERMEVELQGPSRRDPGLLARMLARLLDVESVRLLEGGDAGEEPRAVPDLDARGRGVRL